MFSRETNSILITVTPEYQESQSIPYENYYLWSYHISIENKGKITVQLLNRSWTIINANGQIQEVAGAGVVGIQPTLEPNEKFEYASSVHLSTNSGMMMGTYEMVSSDGQHFDVKIPAFSLDCPLVKYNAN